MKKQTMVTLAMAMVFAIFAGGAQAQSHSVWTDDNGLVIRDASNGCEYTSLRAFDMVTSWTESSPAAHPAVAHFFGRSKAYGFYRPCIDRYYEFVLIKTAGTDGQLIKGAWNIYRDGVLMCSACDGIADGLGQTVGSYYKVYIDDPIYGPQTWLYSGYIDNRKDF